MKGVNGQQIIMDASRGIVVVKLSSQPTYVDDAMDVTFWCDCSLFDAWARLSDWGLGWGLSNKLRIH